METLFEYIAIPWTLLMNAFNIQDKFEAFFDTYTFTLPVICGIVFLTMFALLNVKFRFDEYRYVAKDSAYTQELDTYSSCLRNKKIEKLKEFLKFLLSIIVLSMLAYISVFIF